MRFTENHREHRGQDGGSHDEHGRHAGFGRGMRKAGRGEGFARGGHRRGGRLFDHGTLRWLLLSLIADKPSHGYELIKAVETRLGGLYSPSPGVIYPSLTLLEEMGALEATAEGGKKRYAITEAGRVLMAENAEALAAAQAVMDKFAARAMRPAPVRDALAHLRSTLHVRLAGDPALTEAQVRAIADILNAAAEKVEQA